jgi:hypothetical protein
VYGGPVGIAQLGVPHQRLQCRSDETVTAGLRVSDLPNHRN